MTERIAEVIERSPVLKAFIASKDIAITIPKDLVLPFMQLVNDYADHHDVDPREACCRIDTEILRRGIAALTLELVGLESGQATSVLEAGAGDE